MGLDDVGSLIIDLIREGRRLLTNTYQASGLICQLGTILLVCVFFVFVVFAFVFSGWASVCGWRAAFMHSLERRIPTPLTVIGGVSTLEHA